MPLGQLSSVMLTTEGLSEIVDPINVAGEFVTLCSAAINGLASQSDHRFKDQNITETPRPSIAFLTVGGAWGGKGKFCMSP